MQRKKYSILNPADLYAMPFNFRYLECENVPLQERKVTIGLENKHNNTINISSIKNPRSKKHKLIKAISRFDVKL
ncbi:MAG: hypothetical protein BGO31_11125 [Bacteroidetes bacterium 43-16]|uniref:hypothetical protein n=1 Tax=uncultured Dysgonomonas sp. TaxID=206096 RepID=UPI00092AED3C|nr:hypothetical protein [uncultured Dysgonomonas sp.]OJV51011.1 MAG: hypothetical protein BGO31_11125 [Bacteroidetes bacterium 43-16]